MDSLVIGSRILVCGIRPRRAAAAILGAEDPFYCAFKDVPASRSFSLASQFRYDSLFAMLGILPFALLLELFTRACASPVVDAMHPMITQRAELFGRDVAPGFIGYFQTTDESGSEISEQHYLVPLSRSR